MLIYINKNYYNFLFYCLKFEIIQFRKSLIALMMHIVLKPFKCPLFCKHSFIIIF